jgi:hypothetical protein
MTLILPDAPDSPSNPAVIYAFVADHVRDLTTVAAIASVEDRLHDRLRILREREQSCDLIRDALVLCADRRREIDAASVAAGMAASPCVVDLRDV